MQQDDDRFGVLLLALLVGYAVSGLSDDAAPRAAFLAINVGTLALALHSEVVPRWMRASGLAGLAVLSVAIVGDALVDDADPAIGAIYLVAAVVQVLAMLALLIRVAHHRTVRRNTVMGGVAAYILLGFAFASLYVAADALTDQPLLSAAVTGETSIYFSFVTMTTLGYGDITPVTSFAERLVVLEALIGQVFLVTLVARLVSMWDRTPMQRSDELP